MKTEHAYPNKTALKGQVVRGFRIKSASDLEIADSTAAFAAVRGSVGGSTFEYECAGPNVMPEDRKIVRWAVVTRA